MLVKDNQKITIDRTYIWTEEEMCAFMRFFGNSIERDRIKLMDQSGIYGAYTKEHDDILMCIHRKVDL